GRANAVGPGAAVHGAWSGEGCSAKLLGIKAKFGTLGSVLPDGQSPRLGFGGKLVSKSRLVRQIADGHRANPQENRLRYRSADTVGKKGTRRHGLLQAAFSGVSYSTSHPFPKGAVPEKGGPMSLTLTPRTCGDVFILDCVGRIMAGQTTTALEEALEQAEQEHCCIVLNLRNVDRMDSMGLGLLVRHAYRLKSRRGAVRLAEAQPFVAHLIGITKLSEFLASYPTEQAAIESFLGPCPPPAEKVNPGPTLL